MSYSRDTMRLMDKGDSPIDYVQMDGLAVMKMVKHCHEESSGNFEIAQGALLGLVVESRLEITNCFPFPKHDDSIDEEQYQLDMMRRLRRVNVDHFHVGWYQSSDVGNFLSLPLLESQYHYQISIEESVVVIYDTQKSANGFLTLKAYRLTPQAINMYKDNEFTPEALRNLKIGFENLFIEIPIEVRNSPLTNIMLSELMEMVPEEEGNKYLDLGTASVLEGQLRAMMFRVDELNQEAIKFNRYQQQVIRQQQDKHRLLQKRAVENSARQAKDEPLLPDDDINKMFRPIPTPPRLNPMIVSGQINAYGQTISQFCSQSLAKLYVTQALQNAKEEEKNQKKMEARDIKRKEETENAKARLNDIKQLISETLYKITKTECEYNEAKAEYNKKMKALQNTEAEQQVRLCKLNTDLKNSEQVLQTRLAEEVEVQKVNNDLKQELKTMREAADAMTAEFHKKLQDLEEQINRGYAELHSEKDAEALWELGVNSVKNEEQVTLLKDVINRSEATEKDKKTSNSP